MVSVHSVALRGVRKVYGRGASAVPALGGVNGIDVDFVAGTFTAVMGQSGSGKSTLLHCAAGLDRPSAGSVFLGDLDLAQLSETQLTKLRRAHVGFVFQAFNLVSALSVRGEHPVARAPRRSASGRPRRLDGIVSRGRPSTGSCGARPSQLSGGQQQRVAIARALAVHPDVIFCDEPTGALDTTTAGQVLTLLREAVDVDGQTIVMVTHDPVAASYADRVIFLADGQLCGDEPTPGAAAIADRLARLGTSVGRRLVPVTPW